MGGKIYSMRGKIGTHSYITDGSSNWHELFGEQFDILFKI